MPSIKAGDVVVVNFVGATGDKRRPAVVLSTDLYHAQRPDVIVGVITTNVAAATAATDYILQDWQAAGLRKQSAFRTYLATQAQSGVRAIGRLSDRDWQAVRECVQRAMS
ncbi:MAG: type II toxin-antitoxin system PemK/MazF family toxin [Tepidisphaeraceae bacterium]